MGHQDSVIRAGRPADLAWIGPLLKESPEAAQWLPADDPFLVAEPRAGFLVWRKVAEGEFEILNLAVAKEHRRRGLASALLAAAMRPGRWFLEVRQSNRAARGFYGAAGFREAGIRRAYYIGPTEDAIVLVFQSC